MIRFNRTAFAEKFLLLSFFTICTLIYSFYQYLPIKLGYFVLKVPYFFLAFLGIAVFIKLLRKTYRLSGFSRYWAVLFSALFILYVLLSGYRYIKLGFANARNSLYMALAVFFGALLFFCVDSEVLSIAKKECGVLYISTFLNVIQIFVSAITFGGVRASRVLENIMVFNCVMLALLPILFLLLLSTAKRSLKLIALFNIISLTTLVSISGARSAVLVLWGEYLVCSICLFLKKRHSWKYQLLMLVSILAGLGILYSSNFLCAKDSLNRVFFAYQQKLGSSVNAETNQGTTSEAPLSMEDITNSENVVDNQQDHIDIVESDSMRGQLWAASIEEIKRSPLLGTGVSYFDCKYGDIILEQSSHNFVLEIWLVFGGIGLIMYILIVTGGLVYFSYKIIQNKGNRLIPLFYLLSLSSILLLALVQPLLTMLPISSLFWLIVGWGYKDCALHVR